MAALRAPDSSVFLGQQTHPVTSTNCLRHKILDFSVEFVKRTRSQVEVISTQRQDWLGFSYIRNAVYCRVWKGTASQVEVIWIMGQEQLGFFYIRVGEAVYSIYQVFGTWSRLVLRV